MNWATFAIEALQRGEVTRISPRGHSMHGRVEDGDLVTLEPCDPATLKIGDVVLVRAKGHVYLHLIKAVDRGRYLIGNNRGGTNGWVSTNSIYGRAIKIESP